MVGEALQAGCSILLNQSGIPSLTATGMDSSEDLVRSMTCVTRSINLSSCRRGLPTSNLSSTTLYALVIAINFRRWQSLSSNLRTGQLIITSGLASLVPLIVPFQIKGPLSPLPSRINHTVLEYCTGFASDDTSKISTSRLLSSVSLPAHQQALSATLPASLVSHTSSLHTALSSPTHGHSVGGLADVIN